MGEYSLSLCWCASVAPVGMVDGLALTLLRKVGKRMATQKQINKWLLSLPADERQNVAQSSAMGHVYPQLVTGSKVMGVVESPKAKALAQSKRKTSTR
jgi:hypothetical protein